ncbi:MAG: bifunctional 3-(3-hydroxy-phenyl)propionate/3-hydroxycinnamic acid hydroxylase [Burkholderiales bacterium]
MTQEFDVAIVGLGPVGAALANLLGQAGVSVVAFERDAEVYPLPRAVHFDGEVMRIFHTMGLKAEVEAVTRPGLKPMEFVNAEGRVLLVRGGNAALGPHGCANNHYFNQPQLERTLRAGLRRFPAVHLKTRHEVFAIAEDGDGATLSVENCANGELLHMRARYVVGCDGARSLVRRLMGSRNEDLGLHQPWLVFDALLKRDPGLPDHTVQYCDPQRPITYCNLRGERRRWEIMLMPGDDPVTIARPENVYRLLSRWISPEDVDLERAVVYTFHSVITHGWRRGRLMIAGDSAHQTPPFLGQGMCAGIRDAANLAWKLALVLNGAADDSLLETYESERLPHVRAFIELAVKLGDMIQTVDPEVAAERDRRLAAGDPEVITFPAPGLGPGVREDAAAPVGQPFPQPPLADGHLLDNALGGQFGLIGRAKLLGTADEATRQRLRETRVVELDDRHPALRDWLDAHDAGAVLLRPDRYVAGVARDAAGLERLAALLPHLRAA